MRAITQNQLDLARRAPSLLDAASFPTIFPQPKTSAHRSFLTSLVGRYSAFELRGDHLLLSDLILKRITEAGVLVAHEALSLFQVRNVDLLKRETRNLSADAMLAVWPRLPAFGCRDAESFTSTGFVAATSEMMTLFLRGSARGFASVLNVERLDFSATDEVRGMQAWRNAGWTSASERSRPNLAAMPPRDRMRRMARETQYLMNVIDRTYKNRHSEKKPEHARSSSKKEFVNTAQEFVFESEGRIERSNDSTERLLAAIARNDLQAFRQALADRADPNVPYLGSADPIVFPLAADGRCEWVEALIATGRCDLTRTGADGFWASHAPGVTARFFAASGPDEITRKFSKIAHMLYAEEARQLLQQQSGPGHKL